MQLFLINMLHVVLGILILLLSIPAAYALLNLKFLQLGVIGIIASILVITYWRTWLAAKRLYYGESTKFTSSLLGNPNFGKFITICTIAFQVIALVGYLYGKG